MKTKTKKAKATRTIKVVLTKSEYKRFKALCLLMRVKPGSVLAARWLDESKDFTSCFCAVDGRCIHDEGELLRHLGDNARWRMAEGL